MRLIVNLMIAMGFAMLGLSLVLTVASTVDAHNDHDHDYGQTRPDYAFISQKNPDAANQAVFLKYRRENILYCNLKALLPNDYTAPTIGVQASTNQPDAIYAKSIRIPCGTLGNLITIQGATELTKYVLASSYQMAPFTAAYTAGIPASFFVIADLFRPYDFYPKPFGLEGALTDAHFARLRQTYYPFMIKKTTTTDLNAMAGIIPLPQLTSMKSNVARIWHEDYEGELMASNLLNNSLLTRGIKTPARRAFFRSTPGSDDLIVEGIWIRNSWVSPQSTNSYKWLLAKVFSNVVPANLTPLDHFLDTHLVMSPLMIAAMRCLLENHPVALLLNLFSPLEAGTIRRGEIGIFNNGVGNYDVISGWGASAHHVHYNAKESAMSWLDRTFEKDMERRGVNRLPGYVYREDMKAWNTLLFNWIEDRMNAHFESDEQVRTDAQLQCMMREAANRTSATNPVGQGELFEFPEVNRVSTLVEVLTHMVLTSYVKHHAMNTKAYYGAQMLIPISPYNVYCEFPENDTLADAMTEAFFMSCMPNPAQAGQMIRTVLPYDRPFPMQDSMTWLPDRRGGGTAREVKQADDRATEAIQKLNKKIRAREAGRTMLPYHILDGDLLPNKQWV